MTDDEMEAMVEVQYAAGKKIALIRGQDFRSDRVQDAISAEVIGACLPGDTVESLVARCAMRAAQQQSPH